MLLVLLQLALSCGFCLSLTIFTYFYSRVNFIACILIKCWLCAFFIVALLSVFCLLRENLLCDVELQCVHMTQSELCEKRCTDHGIIVQSLLILYTTIHLVPVL